MQVLGKDGQPCAFERRHSRILAILLLTPNQLVGRDYLIDAVWDEAPPATAARQLQNCISSLRQHLPKPAGASGGDWKHVIAAEPAGYRIHLDSGQLDAEVFDVSVVAAKQHQTAGRIADAATQLRQALALWQGPALAGLTGRAIEAGSARLNEQRLSTLESCLELELQQGQYPQLVGELLELVSANPLRESIIGLLMRALHGSGRQSEALQAYDQLRKRLAEELGLDPGPQLQELHASILRNSVPIVGAAATVSLGQTALRQLPAPVRHFVGRDAALQELDRLADAVGEESVMISVIHGTGGVGKTALAVRWAHRAASRFPDGQLFANLRGFDPSREPLTPAEVIRGFLDAFAIPADQIPVGLDAQASLYRSLLAERRVLIVLDNARDVDQVRPLLPGSSGCLVIVTSRNELTGLVAVEGAHPLTVDLLTAAEAHNLLASHLGTSRLQEDPGAVGELVSRCARLPLALAIIAARAAAHPTFPLGTFAAELADTQRRLDAVDGGDQYTQVRSVFSWSYQRLSTQAAHLFRHLGLHRGPDITIPAAAHLAGLPQNQARQLLTDLSRAHMVNERVTGRYAFHDLLSAYASEQAEAHDSESGRRAAVRRLFVYKVHAASRADELLTPHRRRTPLYGQEPPGELPSFPGHAEALAWLSAERGNLAAAVRQAWEYQEYELGWRMANLMWGMFRLEKHWDDWLGTDKIGLACAQACGDHKAEFTMLSSLGVANRELRRFDEAMSYQQQALELSRRTGDRRNEAQALNGIGAVWGDMKRPEESFEYLAQALPIWREVGDRWGEAITISNLGEEDLVAGRIESSRRHFLAALVIQQEIGDRWGEAAALSYLGQVHKASQQYDEARHYLQEALAIHRELLDHSMEAFDLHHLGIIHRSLGQTGQSEACLREALAIYQRLNMPAASDVGRLLAGQGN